ncbi:MAG: aconitate hydratase AcnA [Phycisphaeraceae bacterium]|nr:aconitate hydratase AcnA [Phycisphaeraceae bacterium]
MADSFHACQTLETPLGKRKIHRLDALGDLGSITQLPYCIKVLLEAALRNLDGFVVTEEAVKALASYNAANVGETEVPFKPGRVVLQDFTGVPAVVDLAAMRSAIVRMTGRAESSEKVNPLVACDLVIDHSVQVDAYASGEALTINGEKEFERNQERYEFLKWGQQAFDNFRVVPPATGIVHQVNLEYLSTVVWDYNGALYPDSLVGTDSHTTMINGLGIVGWGVGGIEAEAVMLGQPIYMLIPEVVGVRLTGALNPGATATDLVLQLTQMLRAHGVVGKFVEFFGDGLAQMPLANRATIANMAPEYGATIGFFPVDERSIEYLQLTGRDPALIETVELYCREQGLWRNDHNEVVYSDVLELDVSQVQPALAGPKRPQDHIELNAMQSQWISDLDKTFGCPPKSTTQPAATATLDPQAEGVETEYNGQNFSLQQGAVVIAAITSCTNTSNPQVMVGAGLLAQKARARGLQSKPWVKTSLAPGSKVVTEYLTRAALMDDLEALGFHLVGYGCTTCIGNSGPLPEPIANGVQTGDLVVAAVLSGNRNFEGRVNPHVKANYLASPPLVVAYAIAGTVDIDLTKDPIGQDPLGNNVYLKDIWPSQQEVEQVTSQSIGQDQFVTQYASVFEGSDDWKAIKATTGNLYEWKQSSTYIQEPPFFVDLKPQPNTITEIRAARCLAKFGDSVTTDHISPAGSIVKDSPAGQYLTDNGVSLALFNSYGSRRGNDRVMTRGTFANIRVRNQLAPGTEGGFTTCFADDTDNDTNQITTIYDAAMVYHKSKVPLIVLAGKDYGMGSSRDWAAKGTFLLGVKAVIAESFERIHRSNLVGMGVLPLCYRDGQTADSLGLSGHEFFDIAVNDTVQPRQNIQVIATDPTNGNKTIFDTMCRIDTPVEVTYYRNGGILHTVLRKMAKS